MWVPGAQFMQEPSVAIFQPKFLNGLEHIHNFLSLLSKIEYNQEYSALTNSFDNILK